MDLLLLEKTLLGSFVAILVAILVSKVRGKRFKLPPGPIPVPVFGNWLQVGDDLNHRNLTDLAKKFGDILLLRMGQRNLVVVSSPDLAKEVLHTQGVEFGSRTRNVVFDIFTGKGQDMVFTVYGEHWRKMRRIMTVPFFTNKVVQQYRYGWEEEAAQVVEDVRKNPEAATRGIVLRSRLQLMMYNNMYRIMFDRRFESEEDPLFNKLKALNGERSRLAQSFDYNYGDFIPILRPFLRGYLKICREVKERRLQLFKDYFVEERKKLGSTKSMSNEGLKCAIDHILDAQKKGEINEDNVLYIVENINVAEMGTKICMNASCQTTTTHEWKRGWPLRSGGHALLCFNCGSAYEDSLFCDTFHSEEPGWRECNICTKRLHCGCIASKFLLELLDYGGVGCSSCARSSCLHSIQCDEIPNGFGSLTRNNAGDLESIPVESTVAANDNDEGGLAQLCRLIEASEPSLLHPSERANTNGCLGQFRQEEIRHAIGDIGTGFSNMTLPSIGSSKFTKPDNMSSLLDMGDMHSSLSEPSLSMALGAPSGTTNFAPFPGGAVEGREQSKTPSSFQQGQRSRPILPKPSKLGLLASSENNKGSASELRIARPPAEGRGKNQLLPRYWPRITDQELQQLSGDLNSNIVPLFEKILSASDAGRIGRLVLPKACAEAYFPSISQSEGIPLKIQDIKGREWTFQFRFWPNNNSRMYVLEGVTPCIQSMQLKAGDTITFSRIDPGGKLVMGFRKSTNNNEDAQDAQASGLLDGTASGETSLSADGYIGWNNSENHGGGINGDLLQQITAPTEKKRTRNIGPKSKRLLMHSEDAMELRLTWEEAQDLLRPPPSVNPTVVTIEDHEFEEYDEPPVFGKRTIFTSRSPGRQEQWAQCDDCSKWRKLPVDALLPPKWTCSENAWDSSRCICSVSEEMTPKDLDNLLRVSKDFKKRRILESQKRFQDCEPSGLDALASAAVLGDNIDDSGEPSVGATTKHPRHRPGCTCIVCIQPPSGKGKHKPTCTCNVCMTVKRRFKTLMLRKKKRQSEREAETSQKDNTDRKDPEVNGAMSHEALHINNPETAVSQSKMQTEKPETSAGQIDLNCHPNREDMPLDMPGLTTMNLVDMGNTHLDSYIKQNGLSSLVWDQQGDQAQHSGESLRRLSDEAFLASIGWNHESRRD